jgi:hypothetical protein
MGKKLPDILIPTDDLGPIKAKTYGRQMIGKHLFFILNL